MFGKIIFLYALTAAYGKILQRSKPINPEPRTIQLSDIPLDIYDFESQPYLRTDDYIKLPRELFEQWVYNQSGMKAINRAVTSTEVIEPTTVATTTAAPNKKIVKIANTKITNDKTKEAQTTPKVEPKSSIVHESAKKENEVAVKTKLFSLIRKTKDAIDKKLSPIQTVHNAFKSNKMYKIGFLVSNINRTQDSLTDFYTFIEKNVDGWDILKTLNAYDQVKIAEEFLSKALYILNIVGAPSIGYNYHHNYVRPRTTTPETDDRFEWSYYDDNAF